MARYPISQEGADALRKLAKSLSTCSFDVFQSGAELQRTLEELSGNEGLGAYGERISALGEETVAIMNRSRFDVNQLSARLLETATRVEEVLNRKLGAQVLGGMNPPGPTAEEAGPAHVGDDVYAEWSGAVQNGTLRFDDLRSDGKAPMVTVDAGDICGALSGTDQSGSVFWRQHDPRGRDAYRELALHLAEVQQRVAAGETLEELKNDPGLRACIEQYYDHPVEVYEYGGKYIADHGGRHRIAIAQELGISIPVAISRRYY